MRRKLIWVLAIVLGLLLAACAPATPQVIEVEKEVIVEKSVVETVVVEKEVAVEKQVMQTVVVEKEVEKKVVETVVVEKEVVVTATPEPKSVGPKFLTVGTSQEPSNLFVLWQAMRINTDIDSMIWRGPIEFFGDNEPHPVLLESLPSQEDGTWVIDEDTGTMEVTYKFKQGLKWADGEEITAEDLVFTFEILSDEQYVYPGITTRVGSIEAMDKYTAKVNYAKIYPFAEQEVGLPVIPEHYYRPIWEEYKAKGGNYWEAFASDERVSVKPLGNGPFKVTEWVPGSHIRLVRNDNFNLGPMPNLDGILIRIIPDLNSLAVNVATKQIQLTDGWLTLEQSAAMEEAPGVKPVFVPAMWLEHATLQVNRPPLNDKRVRQAILHAIDREGINEALFNGMHPLAHSWIPEWHPAYNPDVKKYPYDPDKALELLAEAGWTPGSDGKLKDANGNLLEIPIIPIAGDRTREQVAALVQAQWQEIGITCPLNPVSARLLYSETLINGEMEGMAIWRWVFSFRAEPRPFWYPGEGAASLDQLFEDSPWGQIERNKELIQLIEVETNAEKRYELLQEQQAIWAEELPVLPIYWHTRVATVADALQNYEPADQAKMGWNCEEWDLVQ